MSRGGGHAVRAACALILLAPAAPPAETGFAGVKLLQVGFPQTWIVAADFNEDGADDFFFLPLTDAEPIAMISDGSGFRRQTVEGTYESALHADEGFLDADPHRDLVIAHRPGARVHFGAGDGTFRAGPALDAMFFCRMALIARIDADLHADVVLADEQGGHLRLYRGDGAGGFSHAGDFGLQSEPHAFDLGDLDGDGRLDAVFTVGVDDLVGVAPGAEGGTFGGPQFYEVGRNNRFAAVGDLNGDGALDVAVTSRNSSTVATFAGTGDGRLYPPSRITSAPQSEAVLAVDLDGDGRLDLVVAGGGEEQHLAVHTGREDDAFAWPLLVPVARGKASLPVGLCVGDYSRDGRPDVLVASLGMPQAALVEGGPDGRLRVPLRAPTDGEPTRLDWGDLDGDGNVDLVASLRDRAGVLLFLGDGRGGFAAPRELEASSVPTDVLVADVSGDGILDVAATDLLDGLTIWIGRGSASFDPAVTIAAGLLPEAVAAGDLNGDGNVDIVVANRGSGDVSVFPSEGGGSFGDPIRVPVGAEPVDVVAGDWNRDGLADFAAVNRKPSSLSVVFGREAGPLSGHSIPVGGVLAQAAVGDVDGDGAIDIAVADRGSEPSGGLVLVFRGTGDGSFEGPLGLDCECEPRAVTMVDPDGDGRAAVAAACWDTGALLIFDDDGTGEVARRGAYYAGRAPEAVLAADLTGDGHEDLVVTSASGSVAVLPWGELPVPLEATFRRGQVNDDGRLDISDPIGLLGYLFLAEEILPCPDAADSNDDGGVDLSDAVYALGHLFLGEPAPPEPGPDVCGTDPTPDDLPPCAVPCR